MNEHNVTLFVLILAIVLLLSAISRMIFLGRTKKTEGTIIAIERDTRGEAGGFFVTAEYTTEKGRIYQYTHEFRDDFFFLHVGDPIDVYYDPKKPYEEVLIGNPLVSVQLVFAALGLAIVIYAVIKMME